MSRCSLVRFRRKDYCLSTPPTTRHFQGIATNEDLLKKSAVDNFFAFFLHLTRVVSFNDYEVMLLDPVANCYYRANTRTPLSIYFPRSRHCALKGPGLYALYLLIHCNRKRDSRSQDCLEILFDSGTLVSKRLEGR